MKRIMAVGNGNELFEMVGGRVYRHAYDPIRKQYIMIQEDFDGSPWANCRHENITLAGAVAGPLAALELQNMAAIDAAELIDLEAQAIAAQLDSHAAELGKAIAVIGSDIASPVALAVARQSVRMCYKCGADLENVPAYQTGSGWYCTSH